MGKKIAVASTIYSLTGDEDDNPDYIVSNLYSAVISPKNNYLGETVVGNYLNGPGIKQRNFFNYTKSIGYAGLPEHTIQNVSSVDPEVVAGEIPLPASPSGVVNYVQRAFISNPDFEVFAQQHILENYPERIDTDWSADYDSATHEITIQFVSDPTVTFSAGDFNPNSLFLTAEYYQAIPSSVQNLVTGSTTTVTDAANLPDDTGYTLQSTTNTSLITHTRNKNTRIVDSYSDSTPDAVISDTDEDISSDFQNFETLKTKTEYQGGDGNSVETTSLDYFLYEEERRYIVETVTTTTETFDEGGGVTRTRTTTITEDTLEPIWDYRIDTQDTISMEIINDTQIFIYELGSGNTTLDVLAFVALTSSSQEYYPFIPIRLDNVSINEEPYLSNGLYDEARKAYKRATDFQSFEKLIADVEDNESLDEIDYAYMCYGVPLNIKDNASKKYLYKFFTDLIPFQNSTSEDVTSFIESVAANNTGVEQNIEWLREQAEPDSILYNTPRPPSPVLSRLKNNTIRVHTNNSLTKSYDNRISWGNISEETISGLGKIGAKEGEIWIENGTAIEVKDLTGSSSSLRELAQDIGVIHIYNQISLSEHKKLTIIGLEHRNYIYEGKFVAITASEALEDSDPSGFLVPLHNTSLKSLGLVNATQMALSNSYIVFNSYEVYKKKWYQSFLFILVIIIAIVVITVVTGGVGAGTVGLLGSNGGIGATLGLTGTAAVVAGAVLNAFAAIIVSKVLIDVSVDVLGEQFGSIVGSLISFIILGGLDSITSNFGSATSIMNLSNVIGNSYAGWIRGESIGINNQISENQEEYDKAMDKINELMKQLGTTNDLYFDPLSLTNLNKGNDQQIGSYVPESLDEFIHRTTLVGSDIVDITISMVNEYTDFNLQLPKNIIT